MSDTETLTEGLDVATAGFPMGSRALEGPDGLYQLCPTLQRGIISAVLPFPGRRPKAFSVQIMTHGGASGSPVFLPDSGRVVGVLYAALSDTARTARRDACTFPTGISYAVPARAITRMASRVREMPQMRSPADAPDLNQLICENTPGHIYRDGACYPVRPAARPLSLPNLELLNPKKEVVHE
ncbi:S1 family peptidase [Desulfonema ishimotonii]|uniref:S1 family peptidase n=1 Tax=Desulfonema ishimotonii TaxID=45657 RepID=UPI001E2F229B|nr:serine protease [Desulfonema ishimotonii]